MLVTDHFLNKSNLLTIRDKTKIDMITQIVVGYDDFKAQLSNIFDSDKKLEIFLFLAYSNNRKLLNANEKFKQAISKNPK